MSAGSQPGPRVIVVPGWAAPVGYSDAVAGEGTVIVLAGQVGWDPATRRFVSDDFAEQAAQALRNVVAALAASGAGPRALARLTWFITAPDEYLASRARLGVAYREIIGRHFPAMSVVVVRGLLEPGAKVEIEATAIVGPDRPA